ncbi:MAG: hypothetical protein IJS28_06340, partial [Synergistaceae bacterium]|nr:hypothetical protein [Synergistaceae bacterium]
LVQLKRYREILQRRREIITLYDKLCDEIGVSRLNHYGKDYASSGHLYLTRIPGINEHQRNEIIIKLTDDDVIYIMENYREVLKEYL